MSRHSLLDFSWHHGVPCVGFLGSRHYGTAYAHPTLWGLWAWVVVYLPAAGHQLPAGDHPVGVAAGFVVLPCSNHLQLVGGEALLGRGAACRSACCHTLPLLHAFEVVDEYDESARREDLRANGEGYLPGRG